MKRSPSVQLLVSQSFRQEVVPMLGAAGLVSGGGAGAGLGGATVEKGCLAAHVVVTTKAFTSLGSLSVVTTRAFASLGSLSVVTTKAFARLGSLFVVTTKAFASLGSLSVVTTKAFARLGSLSVVTVFQEVTL